MQTDHDKINHSAVILLTSLSVLCASCSAGFDNTRIQSLNIEARRYYEEGVTLASENRTEEAIQSYTKSIKAGPSAASYNNRAAEYNRMGRYDDALADANRAIMMSPKYAFPYFNRGNACYNKRDYSRAIGDYARAVKLDPAQPVFYFNMAQAYTRSDNPEKAIEMYGKAVEIDPAYFIAHYNMACLYARKNEARKALESLERSVREGLCNPVLLTNEKAFDGLRGSRRFTLLVDRLEKRSRGPRGCERTMKD